MGAVGSAFEDVWDGIGDAAEWGVLMLLVMQPNGL